MFGYNNFIFNEIEYFTYINMWLFYLLFRLIVLFLLLSSSLLYYISLDFNVTLMEFFFSIFSLWFLWLIISPSLIIIFDFDLILIPCFFVYCLGYQWAWTSNPSFSINYLDYLNSNRELLLWNYSFDHYIVSSFYLFNASFTGSIFNISYWGLYSFPFYLFDINRFLVCPLYSTFKLWLLSLDVIHCLGLYSFGIKTDAIPGHIHLASTLRRPLKGEHKGYCFELCGQGHAGMLLMGLIIAQIPVSRFRVLLRIIGASFNWSYF